MKAVYLISFGFFGFLAMISYYHFRRKNITLTTFLFSWLAFVFLMIFSLSPGLTDILVEGIGLQNRGNFISVVIVTILTTYIWVQVSINTRFARSRISEIQNMSIVRAYSLSNLKGDGEFERRGKVVAKMAACNEEKNIGAVLGAMPGGVDILVVDDGSEDNTFGVAREKGAMVLRHIENLGQGAADLTGFYVAFDLGYEYIIEMDADGQHDPAEILNFVKALDDNQELDIVVGSRLLGGFSEDASKLRMTFLPLYTRIINWASGYKLTDSLCGFKAFRTSTLVRHPQLFSDIVETQYIAAEQYIRFGRAGLRVGEIPVYIADRSHGQSHKGTFRYGFAVLWIIFRTLLVR